MLADYNNDNRGWANKASAKHVFLNLECDIDTLDYDLRKTKSYREFRTDIENA